MLLAGCWLTSSLQSLVKYILQDQLTLIKLFMLFAHVVFFLERGGPQGMLDAGPLSWYRRVKT